ncbi:MAG: molybdopterin molybdenumtransferase MoeA, partial [Sulfurovaceae bacterium]
MAFISFEESLKILDAISIKEKVTIELGTAEALGFVLARDITAQENSPASPTSAMDGYALAFEDMQHGKLKVLGDNPAGQETATILKRGTCIKTFTGSLMPKGTDTLIPIENVEYKDGYIDIKKEVPRGFSVREVGEHYAKGELLLKHGSLIDFIQIGLLASLN